MPVCTYVTLITLTVITLPVCDVTKIEIKLRFQSSRFPIWTKMYEHKFRYLKNKKSFQQEIKSIFHHFHRLLVESDKTKFFQRREPNFKLFFIRGYLKMTSLRISTISEKLLKGVVKNTRKCYTKTLTKNSSSHRGVI